MPKKQENITRIRKLAQESIFNPKTDKRFQFAVETADENYSRQKAIELLMQDPPDYQTAISLLLLARAKSEY